MAISFSLNRFSFTLDHLGLLIKRPTWTFSWTDGYGFMLERMWDDGRFQTVWAQAGMLTDAAGDREPLLRPVFMTWLKQQTAIFSIGAPKGEQATA